MAVDTEKGLTDIVVSNCVLKYVLDYTNNGYHLVIQRLEGSDIIVTAEMANQRARSECLRQTTTNPSGAESSVTTRCIVTTTTINGPCGTSRS